MCHSDNNLQAWQADKPYIVSRQDCAVLTDAN